MTLSGKCRICDSEATVRICTVAPRLVWLACQHHGRELLLKLPKGWQGLRMEPVHRR